MRVEFQDLITARSMFDSGLFVLSHMVKVIEDNVDSEEADLYGISDLIKLLAIASKKQTHDLADTLSRAEKEAN